MTRLRHANGATVEVPAEKVERLLRMGFTLVAAKPAAKKTTARKSAAAKKSEDD